MMAVSGSHSSRRSVDASGDTPEPYMPPTAQQTLTRRQSEAITQLARTVSCESQSHERGFGNPFEENPPPSLDPDSPEFDVWIWLQAFMASSPLYHGQKNPISLGISFRELKVDGKASRITHKSNVFNIMSPIYNAVLDKATKRPRLPILRGFDGLVNKGEMLVVLGRPGSGVSTLLKTLAGELRGLHVDSSSTVNYSGIPGDLMRSRFWGEVIYQSETDVHFPHLTVAQTLLFAALARTHDLRPPGVSRSTYAKHLRDVVMTVLGLSQTANTRVGNDYIRGVSGGERKRVSIAEAVLSASPLQFWDNSTRGLDSATALQFVRTLRTATELTHSTTFVAIYQASESAYELFDKVTLLYEGRQIFFGASDEAKQYFTDMGYYCHPRQTTADFLTSLTNPHERCVREGFEHAVPRTPDEFWKHWKASREHARLLNEIAAFEREHPFRGEHMQDFKAARKRQQSRWAPSQGPYNLSITMQTWLCLTRGFQRLFSEPSFAIVTVIGVFVVALVLASIFFDLPPTVESFFARGALIFFAVLFNALSSSLEIFTLFSQRPIVEKQVSYGLYHPLAEAVSSMIVELPIKVCTTIAFNVPLYFMAHLRRELEPFVIFLFVAFSCTLTMSMIFRFIAQISRSIYQAMVPAVFFILALVIYTGYILPVQNMKGWLRWINYVNPLAYAFEALMANEFHNREFQCIQFIPAYPDLSPSQRTCATPGVPPGSETINGDLYINTVYGYFYSHLWRNVGIIYGFMAFSAFMYLLASSTISFQESRADSLTFLKKARKLPAVQRDCESQPESASEKVAESPSPLPELSGLRIQDMTFSWKDIRYQIPIKGETHTILDNVSGWVKPGTLTALMGATGAGKTSLLDVLASRHTIGTVSGDIMVNGVSRAASFPRKIGYVQQQDLHLHTTTVREALQFSALLRQPASVSRKDKLSYVEEVISVLEMTDYADAIVGETGHGLNVEQRKRLSIGVELAAKPELLVFLDEPTSGLDSQTAWSICSLIKRLSSQGQAILCTIHQPSAILFEQFDRLLLLGRGGRTVYFGDIGEQAQTLTSYLERHGVRKCENAENPAEWMLEVIGAAPGSHAVCDWPRAWIESPEYEQMHQELSQIASQAGVGHKGDDEPRVSSTQQIAICSKRVFEQYWRTPSYIYSKLILCAGSSLMIGLSFWKQDLTAQGMQNQMFSIFMLMVIFAFLVYQTLPLFMAQRDLFEVRERPSKVYSWSTFMLVNIIVDIPWDTLAALLIFVCFYYPMGMNRNAEYSAAEAESGGLMFLLIWAFMLFTSTFTKMVAAGSSSAEIGAIVGLVVFVFTILFCGVIATPEALPGFWIFMYRLSPFTYLVGAILSTGLGNTPAKCTAIELRSFEPAGGMTCGAYMDAFVALAGGEVYNPNATESCQYCLLSSTSEFLAAVSASYDDRWRNFALMWVYIIFNIAAATGLYWLVRVPKAWTTVSLSGIWKIWRR